MSVSFGSRCLRALNICKDNTSLQKPLITIIYLFYPKWTSGLRCWILSHSFVIQLSGCGSSSEKLSVAQAESCQVGSTVFPLEFISPTTYGEGCSLVCPGITREERRELLNTYSFLPPCLCFFDGPLLYICCVKESDDGYLSSLILHWNHRFVTGQKKGHSGRSQCMWKFLF